MKEALIPWLISIGTPFAVTIIMALFCRVVKRQKLRDWIGPKADSFGVTVSHWILRWVPYPSAKNIEENGILTLLDALSYAILQFKNGMLRDNVQRREQKQAKKNQ